MTKSEKPPAEHLRCPNCGAPLDAGDRFCRQCGVGLSGKVRSRAGPGKFAGLRALGLAIVALAILYAILHYGGRERGATPGSERIPITAVGSGAEAPVSLSAREAADELFNEAMAAYESSDSAGAQRFIPMAIAAYAGLGPLDLDAHYHVALLDLAAGRPADALAQADTILAAVPDHLLGLSVAARSYDALGRPDRASEYFQRLLDAYSPELAASRPEYIDHARALPIRLEAAREYLERHGRDTTGPAR